VSACGWKIEVTCDKGIESKQIPPASGGGLGHPEIQHDGTDSSGKKGERRKSGQGRRSYSITAGQERGEYLKGKELRN